MRYARLELEGRDRRVETRLALWENLCGYWAEGMRGLRVKVELEENVEMDEDVEMGEGGRRACRWVEG